MNALKGDTITDSHEMRERLEEQRNLLRPDYASGHNVSIAHARAVVRPSRPPQHFNIANEPSLSASASSSASTISYNLKIGLLALTGYVYTTPN